MVALIQHHRLDDRKINNLVWSYDTDKTLGNKHLSKALWESIPTDELSCIAQSNLRLSGLDAGTAWTKKPPVSAKVRLENDGVYLEFELLDKRDIERLERPKCTLYMEMGWIESAIGV